MDSTGGSFLEPLHSQSHKERGSFALGTKQDARDWWGTTAEQVVEHLCIAEGDKAIIRLHRQVFRTPALREAIRKMAVQFNLNQCAIISVFAVLTYYQKRDGALPPALVHAAAVHLETLTPPPPSKRLYAQWQEGEIRVIKERICKILE